MKNNLLHYILAAIEAIEKDEKLYREKNFGLRTQAIDDIEFHIIGQIDALMESGNEFDRLNALKQYGEKVKGTLEDTDTKMFHELRTKISQGGYRGKLLTGLVAEYFDDNLSTLPDQDAPGYDDLDGFLNGLLTHKPVPAETKDREPEMVFYQKTPARIVFELVKKAKFKPHDVFFDLGSGLGQVTLLVNLLTGATAKGVEFEPAFCSYAKACAAGLNLTGVDFINTDARYADYSAGTIFFMYTPFEGKMLQHVLQNLNAEAKKRKIRLFTYGPCTPEVAQQNWLKNISTSRGGLSEFVSV